MKSLFIDIREKIMNDAAFSEDFHVDENYGQLDTETDYYPVAFPCILLDIDQAEWENPTREAQVGTCHVKVSMAIDCSDSSIDERMDYFHELHRLLHNFSAGDYTPLVRKSFQTQFLPGSIKVYECIYTCTVTIRESAKLRKEPVSSISINCEVPKFVLPELEELDHKLYTKP